MTGILVLLLSTKNLLMSSRRSYARLSITYVSFQRVRQSSESTSFDNPNLFRNSCLFFGRRMKIICFRIRSPPVPFLLRELISFTRAKVATAWMICARHHMRNFCSKIKDFLRPVHFLHVQLINFVRTFSLYAFPTADRLQGSQMLLSLQQHHRL